LPELVPDEWLAPAGDPAALAAVIARLANDPGAGRRGREIVRRHAGAETVAQALRIAYDAACA
jgi:glycosyltransferase involved in cell wall biosynthesis